MKLIQLTQGQHALVDDSDFEYLSQWKWYAVKQKSGLFYAARSVRIGPRRNNKRIRIHMHREIMNTPIRLEVDHWNGHGLDNQRHNLKNCTRRENMQNLHIPTTSKFPGVCWAKGRNKWASHISIENTDHTLGYFDSELVAAKAYVDACKGLG